MQIAHDDQALRIRRLYFTERLSFEQIAERLDFSLRTVRRALVIDGGVPTVRIPGPFAPKENEHDRASHE